MCFTFKYPVTPPDHFFFWFTLTKQGASFLCCASRYFSFSVILRHLVLLIPGFFSTLHPLLPHTSILSALHFLPLPPFPLPLSLSFFLSFSAPFLSLLFYLSLNLFFSPSLPPSLSLSLSLSLFSLPFFSPRPSLSFSLASRQADHEQRVRFQGHFSSPLQLFSFSHFSVSCFETTKKAEHLWVWMVEFHVNFAYIYCDGSSTPTPPPPTHLSLYHFSLSFSRPLIHSSFSSLSLSPSLYSELSLLSCGLSLSLALSPLLALSLSLFLSLSLSPSLPLSLSLTLCSSPRLAILSLVGSLYQSVFRSVKCTLPTKRIPLIFLL